MHYSLGSPAVPTAPMSVLGPRRDAAIQRLYRPPPTARRGASLPGQTPRSFLASSGSLRSALVARAISHLRSVVVEPVDSSPPLTHPACGGRFSGERGACDDLEDISAQWREAKVGPPLLLTILMLTEGLAEESTVLEVSPRGSSTELKAAERAASAPAPDATEEKGRDKGAATDVERGSTSTAAEQTDDLAVRDPNIVDWDGPDDPANAMNWPLGQKAVAVATISLITLLTYVRTGALNAPGRHADAWTDL